MLGKVVWSLSSGNSRQDILVVVASDQLNVMSFMLTYVHVNIHDLWYTTITQTTPACPPLGLSRIDAISARPLDASETLLYIVSKQAADTARLSKLKLRVDTSSSPPTVTSIDALGIVYMELPVSVLTL